MMNIDKELRLKSAGKWTHVDLTSILNNLLFDFRNKDKQCTFHKLFPTGTISSCRQHYTIRSLIVSNPDGTISKDYFSIPSCCKCVLLDSRSFSAPITSRMGGRPKPDNSEMMFTFSP